MSEETKSNKKILDKIYSNKIKTKDIHVINKIESNISNSNISKINNAIINDNIFVGYDIETIEKLSKKDDICLCEHDLKNITILFGGIKI